MSWPACCLHSFTIYCLSFQRRIFKVCRLVVVFQTCLYFIGDPVKSIVEVCPDVVGLDVLQDVVDPPVGLGVNLPLGVIGIRWVKWEQGGGGFRLGVVHPALQDVRRHAPSLVHCLVGAHVVDGITIKKLKRPVFHRQELVLLYGSHLPKKV